MRAAVGIAAVIALGTLILRPEPHRKVIVLPAGVVDVRSEMIVEAGTEVRGAPSGTVLRMAADFPGRAVIVARGAGIRLHDFAIEGNREMHDARAGLPP